MTAQPPSGPPSLATIDLSGGDETPAAAAGRIIGGLITMLVGGVAAIALFGAYVAGWAFPAIADWVELLGDVLLWGAAIAAGIAITGFTIMRRGRKVRAQEAAEAAAVMTRLQADMDAATQKPIPPTGPETHL